MGYINISIFIQHGCVGFENIWLYLNFGKIYIFSGIKSGIEKIIYCAYGEMKGHDCFAVAYGKAVAPMLDRLEIKVKILPKIVNLKFTFKTKGCTWSN